MRRGREGETLADVYEAIREDVGFAHLRTEGIVLVPGDGPSQAKVMIVGEAPGASENTAVRPFVGASGKVLRTLAFEVAGLPVHSTFITNVVKYRPQGNRTPVPFEIGLSVPYLRREWRAIGCPKVIVAVGGTAKNALAPALPSVTKSAGVPAGLSGGRWIWPMLHPAYGLRNPAVQPAMEEHWEALGLWYRKEFA